MKQEEINSMLDQCYDEPDSKLGRFVLNPNNRSYDLLDFIKWVDDNTDVTDGEFGWRRVMKGEVVPQTYDSLIEKYLSL